MKHHIIGESRFSRFFTSDTRSAPLWLVLRVYVGLIWLKAGWAKMQNDAWVGESAGGAVEGFVRGALEKTGGPHPDVQGWYAAFLENVVLPNASTWGHLIAWGEVLVGIALIVGLVVGISAFFGAFMNLNFLLAGAVSVNPIMYTIAIGLILAWRVAGYWGLDHYVLPRLNRYFRPRIRTEEGLLHH